MKKKQYPIVICAVSVLVLFCFIGISNSAFSVYMPYLISMGGLTSTQASSLLSIRSIATVLTMSFLTQQFHHRLGIRLGLTLAAIVSACGFVSYSFASKMQSYPMFIVSVVLCGIAYALGSMIPVSILLNRWFKTYSTTALGIAAAGSGLSSIISPPVLTGLIERYSLSKAFIFVAAFMLVCSVIIYSTIRNYPEQIGSVPFDKPEKDGRIKKKIYSVTDVDRTTLILMLLAILLLGGAGQSGNQHVSVFLKSKGYSAASVATFLSIGGAVLFLSKTVYGRLTDRMGAHRSGRICFCSMMIGWICLYAAKGSVLLAVLAVVFLQASFPLLSVGVTAYAKDMVSEEKFAKAIRNFEVATTSGVFIFSSIPGLIYDKLNSYNVAYIIIMIVTVITVVLIEICYGRKEKENKNTHSES